MRMPKLTCSCVNLYRRFRITLAFSPRFSVITMRMPSRDDSSRISEMPSIFLSRTRSAMLSISFALFT